MEPSKKVPKSKFAQRLAADLELRARYEKTVADARKAAEPEVIASEKSTQFTADDFNHRIGSSGPAAPKLRERIMLFQQTLA